MSRALPGTRRRSRSRNAPPRRARLDLWFATGLALPDALAAGPAVAKVDGVLLLVHGTNTSGGQEVYDYLRGLGDEEVQRATFVGGTSAITDAVATDVLDAAGLGG